MNNAKRIGPMISELQKQRLYECARIARDRADAMLRSFSGADQADSEAFFCERRVYIAVADGESLDDVLKTEDARWRAYATEQAKKVNDAPKIKRGPMCGHSAISHRWVSPEKFTGMMSHIRFMVTKSLEAVQASV